VLARLKNKKAVIYMPYEQVILEKKKGLYDGLPHLINVSREKRPHYHHNYKVGAMNVLVSFDSHFF